MTPARRLLTAEQRAASILRAAARAFVTGGFAATSMDAIAAEAGITKLIIYRHFDSKEQLYEAVLDTTRQQLSDTVRWGEGAPGPQTLRLLIAAARSDPDGFALLFRHAAREPRFARYATVFSRDATAAAEQSFEGVVEDPVLRRWLARVVFIATIEGVLAWLEMGDEEGDDVLSERLLHIVGAMVDAVAPGYPADRGW